MSQNYSNHTRLYPPHHFIFYPVAVALTIFAVKMSFDYRHDHFIWMTIAVVIVLIVALSYMLRQHYALRAQDRVIRLEMRFRYYVLTQQRLEKLEDRLTLNQIIALRFASDEELPALVQRAANEQLSPKQIKQAIMNWVPDHMRV
jgi:hypothetical protein